jgi:hypothetical protein
MPPCSIRGGFLLTVETCICPVSGIGSSEPSGALQTPEDSRGYSHRSPLVSVRVARYTPTCHSRSTHQRANRPKNLCASLRNKRSLDAIGPRAAKSSPPATLAGGIVRRSVALGAGREEARFALGISRRTSVTHRSPWTRFAPLAARVVAERQQNAPVSPAESLRVCPRFGTNDRPLCCTLRPVLFKCLLAAQMKSFSFVAARHTVSWVLVQSRSNDGSCSASSEAPAYSGCRGMGMYAGAVIRRRVGGTRARMTNGTVARLPAQRI